MAWSDVQREMFYWACRFAPDLADAILQRDGEWEAQLPMLRQAWARRSEAEPGWADAERAHAMAGSLLAGEWLNAGDLK